MGQVESSPAGRTPSYIPSVCEFVVSNEKTASDAKKKEKVIVIGSGCAGLAAAYHLNKVGMNVQLFESGSKLGGHANTILADGIEVDTGFMVYNSLNYPHLVSLFEEIGVEGQDTTMGFSVSINNGSFEYAAGETISKLFATTTNLINPFFYMMIWEITRFNRIAKAFIELPENSPDRTLSTGQFLTKHRFSDYFTSRYLIPMTGAIWSSSNKGILSFPAITLFAFLNNHLLLQVTGNMTWKTPVNRSKEYVEKIQATLGPDRVKLNKRVVSVSRTVDATTGKVTVYVTDSTGVTETCDAIIFACHPDQALAILDKDADAEERNRLSSFKYSVNDTYVHSDLNLMPRSKTAWTCWNYMSVSNNQMPVDSHQPVYVSYWLNKLQHLKHPRNIFVSLNPTYPPAVDKTFARIAYSHPQYTAESVKAQRLVAQKQGHKGTFFCGAWLGYGFHEDGFRSGTEVASYLSGVSPSWVLRRGYDALIPASKPLLESLQKTVGQAIAGNFSSPFAWLLQVLCKWQVSAFMKKGFTRGNLTFKSPDGSQIKIAGKEPGLDKEVIVRVKNPWIWVRIAFESDLGMAKGYLAGEWEVEGTGANYDGLTELLLVLLDNIPNGKAVKPGLDFSNLLSSWIGSAINWLSYRFTMDNSISNSRSNIHAHYDLSNELFKTFLDRDHMMYSCGIFETQVVPKAISKTRAADQVSSSHSLFRQDVTVHYKGTLESAQSRKIGALLSRLEPLGPEHTLLDIGFGWGGICIYAAEKYGCKVHGITLSEEQKALAEERVRAKGLEHLMTFELVDYREFAKKRVKGNMRKFDRIVSCEMIEAVGHNHLNSFFSTVDALLDTEGIFVMQAITMPDARYPLYVRSADFLNTIIFPGGCCPSLGALLNAMAESSTMHLEAVVNMNLHYAETLRQWRYRFNAQLPRILELGFDDAFIRLWNLYLCQCEAGFEAQIINLQILTFSRTGNPNMIAKRAMDNIVFGSHR